MSLMSILFIMNIHKIKQNAQGYPQRLREISSPPQQLFSVGNHALLDMPGRQYVAIIGSRSPSIYGDEVTYKLGTELAAAGVIIVSGLALGTDAKAHKAAVDLGMPTIAVQARGMDAIYPAENRELAKQILKYDGVIISEYPAGTEAYKQNFVARNRIVAGLSDGVLVTEAGVKSGTQHTATFARNENKLVMAVPGNINSMRSAGTNNLIKTGATLVTSGSDVLAAMGFESRILQKPVKADSKEEGMILDLLKEGITQSEELIARTGMSASEFANIITLMEISGKVYNLGAGNWTTR